MSGEDRRWNEFEQQLRAEGPSPTGRAAGLRARLFQLAEGRAFGSGRRSYSRTPSLCATAGSPQPHARGASPVAFTVIYVVEIVVKLGGYGWRGFTSNSPTM